MLFRQLLHERPVTAASYLIGCAGHGVGAVIDPVLEAGEYRRLADALGLRIAFVIDTHVHADHVSTGRQLADAPARLTSFTPRQAPPTLSGRRTLVSGSIWETSSWRSCTHPDTRRTTCRCWLSTGPGAPTRR